MMRASGPLVGERLIVPRHDVPGTLIAPNADCVGRSNAALCVVLLSKCSLLTYLVGKELPSSLIDFARSIIVLGLSKYLGVGKAGGC